MTLVQVAVLRGSDPLSGWLDSVVGAVTSAAGKVAGAVNEVGQDALKAILKGCDAAGGALLTSGNPAATAAGAACAAAQAGMAYGKTPSGSPSATQMAQVAQAIAAQQAQQAAAQRAALLAAALHKPWYENAKVTVPLALALTGVGVGTTIWLVRRRHRR
jgi:hypothetical protein